MGNTIHRSLVLILFVMCLNGSTNADSVRPSEIHLNGSDINILILYISNDLPIGSTKLIFKSNILKGEFEVEPEQPLTQYANFDVHVGEFNWKLLSAKFDLYDPQLEGGHQRIYWTAREEGIYHSWDNANWDKRVSWIPM
ncbi:hypothetical protein VNO77_11868 [Canavalia gladiata]|uniref:Uncharacterized protein n=1 Tax=Canavalia gladiata TaxID=3824 RepID=A0AAN9LWP2_CANGL